MMRTLVARERKLVAVLILVTLIAGIWLTIIEPILAGFAARADQRAAALHQYQINQRNIGSIPRLRRLVERQRDAMRNFVQPVANSATASAMLQERLQRAIDATGGEIDAIEDGDNSQEAARVRLSAKLTLGQLTALLGRLQNEPPYLTVESLDIASNDAVVSGKLETMEVSFEVSLPIVMAQPR